MAVRSDPKYDTDEVSLGYLKKVIAELKEINSTTQETLEKVFSKNYGSQPTTPYHAGDTWTTEDHIYRCIKDRLVGPFSIDDWVIIYDRKERELISDNFLFLSQVDINEQPDGYIETYYLTEDPSFSWDTSLLKSAHEGDFWRTKTETGFCDYVYTKLATNPVSYDWIETNVPITIFNAITGTKKIYLVEPTNYSVGDLWQKIENNKKVYYEASKDSESFNGADWKIIKEELSLKNLESYYIITSEISKELEQVELNINKRIVENSDSLLLQVDSNYTNKETTKLLTQKVDANGESIEAIYGDRTIEIPIKTLSELSIAQKEINIGVSEVAVKTSELERSIQYFACELELYNLTLPSTVDGYLLEDNIYTINHYSYYKGQQVDVTPTLKKGIDGLVITTTDTIIQIETSKDVKISELNNILEFSFNYKDGDQENILIKKLSVSLALQGKTGATGQDGKDGSGVNILGSFETFEELQQAHPTGTMADAYLIQGNLYVWNGSSWENLGNIQGPKGDKGDQGEQGTAGKNGENGQTTYLHIKYSEDGLTFTPADGDYSIGEKPSAWIGQYVDYIKEDSSNFDDYKWYKFTEDIDETLNEMQNELLNQKAIDELEGTELTLKSSAGLNAVDFRIAGNYYQETEPSPDYPSKVEVVKGYNLFDITRIPDKTGTQSMYGLGGISYTKIDDGYSFDGRYNSIGFAFDNLEVGKTYTVSFDLISDMAGLQFHYGVNAYENSTDENKYTGYVSTTTTIKRFDFKFVATEKNLVAFGVYHTQAISGVVTSITNVKLTKDLIEKPYLPYQNIGIKTTGKNLFNKDKTTDNFYYNSNGGTTIDVTNKFINQKIVATSRNYAMSYKYRVTGDNNAFVRIVEFDSNDNFIKRTLYQDNNSIITLDVNTVYFISSVDAGPNAYFEELQIEEGDVVTSCESYKENTIQFDLKGEFIGKLPNGVQDYLVVDNQGNYGIQKNVRKLVLDVSQNIVLDGISNGISQFGLYINDIKIQTNYDAVSILSDYFKGVAWDGSWLIDNSIASMVNQNRIRIYTSQFSTAEEFKTWLTENNVPVYYELAEPYFVSLGQAPIKTLEGDSTMHLLSTCIVST